MKMRLHDIAELAAAFAPTRERHLETTAQGNAFVDITTAAWPCDALKTLRAALEWACRLSGRRCGRERRPRISLRAALHAFVGALTANWVSAGVRLIPLGQTDSQRVLLALEPVVAETAKRALNATLDDLGGAVFRADLASALHETQYTRLFRS